MKTTTTTTTTMLAMVGCAVLCGAPVPGQETLPAGARALMRAQVIEDQEGDLKAAEREYRALLSGEAGESVRQEASLRLGKLLWRLERKDEAKGFLEQAAGGGGLLGAEAATLLRGQGPQGEREKELRAQARAILAKIASPRMATRVGPGGPSNDLKDLLWIGEPAAVETVALLRLRRAEATAAPPMFLGPPPPDHWLCAFLWQLGGPSAEAFFRSVAEEPDVDWRRAYLRPCQGAADSLVPVAWSFVRDPDPEGTVPEIVMTLSQRVPADDFFALLEDPLPTVRGAAFARLLQGNAVAVPRDQVVARIEPVLRRMLADPDPRVARPAWNFFLGSFPSETTFRLVLEWLPKWPAGHDQPQVRALELDGRTVGLLAAAGRTLGPCPAAEFRLWPREQQWIANVFQIHQVRWEADGVDPVLELVELGYQRTDNSASWYPRVVEFATPAEFTRICRLLGSFGHPLQMVEQLARTEGQLAPECFPVLRDLTEEWLEHRPAFFVAAGDAAVRWPAQLIARTDLPEAAEYLADLADRQPVAVWWSLAQAATGLSVRAPHARVAAALRRFLVAPGEGSAGWARNQVFAELARRGDRAAIPLYPQAYGPGLHLSPAADGKGQQRRGAQWLAATWDTSGGAQRPVVLHGYDDAGLLEAWRTLLASDALPEVILDLGGIDFALLAEPVRGMVAETLVERLAELQAAFVAPEPRRNGVRPPSPQEDPRSPDELRKVVGLVASWTPSGDGADDQRYRAAVERLMADQTAGGQALQSLSPRAAPQMREILRQYLHDPDRASAALRVLRSGDVAIRAEDLQLVLQSDSHYVRKEALSSLPESVEPAVLRAVEAMVGDAHSEVRTAACDALGRLLAAESSAALITALRDSDGKVRAAATEALQRIRLYHEQKAFWDQFQEGVSTGREAATGKLLVQAKPGAPRDQRLLAIRSLGALGAPEALPYLIEWTGDADQELAEAVRAAIARIHQQAGIK